MPQTIANILETTEKKIDDFSKEIKYQKDQMEILETKTTITQNSVNKLTRWVLTMTEKIVNELNNASIEVIQSEQQRERGLNRI